MALENKNLKVGLPYNLKRNLQKIEAFLKELFP